MYNMKELQETLKQAARNLEGLGFRSNSFFVDIEDREKSGAEISFTGEEGKARTFGGYLEYNRLHYVNVDISFIISGDKYKILIQPSIQMMKHESDRKTAIVHGLTQLIKDIENYRMRHL